MKFILTDEMKRTIRLLEAINSQLSQDCRSIDFDYIKDTILKSTDPLKKINVFNKKLMRSKIESTKKFNDLFEDWLAWIRSIAFEAEYLNRFLADMASSCRIQRRS